MYNNGEINNSPFKIFYMMKNAFLLCLFVVVLCSCQEKTISSTLRAVDRSIPIDINKLTEEKVVYDFTEILDSIKVIVLDDSNEEALFSNIYEVLITDKYIYIKDNSQYFALLIFDHDGKFVSKLPLGQGPGEIQRLEDFDYDEKNDMLIVKQPNNLMFYTSKGEFIKSEALPFWSLYFACTDEGYLFYNCKKGAMAENEGGDNCVLVTDKNFNIRFSAIPIVSDVTYIKHNKYPIHTSDGIVITQPFSDSIYCVTDTNVSVIYTLEYENKMSRRIVENDGEPIDYQTFDRRIDQDDGFHYLGMYYENQTHQYMTIKKNNMTYDIYRDKTTGNIVGGNSYRYNPYTTPPVATPCASYKDYFVSVFYPSEDMRYEATLMSEDDAKRLMELDEESNLVLILYKLKKL